MVYFDPTSLHRSKSGSITGIIHFTFGKVHFPGSRWSDFVVVILGWWVIALRSNDRIVHLEFMDGPYKVRITREQDNTSTVDCIESRRSEVVPFSDRVKHQVLRDKVEDVGRQVLAACRERNWESNDIRTLEQSLDLR